MLNQVKVFTGFSILGAFFVALGLPLQANLVWCVSNPGLIYHNYKTGQKEQAIMFSVFASFAFFGVVYNAI